MVTHHKKKTKKKTLLQLKPQAGCNTRNCVPCIMRLRNNMNLYNPDKHLS